jgi:uncharacterized phage protein gp47/JayE
MPLTLAQLTTPKTPAQMRQQVLDALNGRGVVTKTGAGTGALSITGVPSVDAAVQVRIAASGEPGAATWQYRLEAGTYSDPAPVPGFSGAAALGATGCTVLFAAGPAGAGTSFVAGDVFAFSLSSASFDVTAWQPGGVARTLVEIEAQALADLTSLIAAVAAGGFVDRASGAWLDLVAANGYGLSRSAAVATAGNVTLTDAGGSGPFVIQPGQLWFAATSGRRFQGANAAAVTLAKSSTLTLPVAAETPGADGDVGAGTITKLLTPLPGVTVSNPGVWVTRSGRDAEKDDALRARCKARWAALGMGGTEEAYRLWATSASPAVTRAKVQVSQTVAGQVDVYVAGTAGTVQPQDAADVSAYIALRAPLGVMVNVQPATASVVNVRATLAGKAQYTADAQAAAAGAVQAVVASTPIGGTVYRSALIEALMSPEGVDNVTLTTPAADVVLTATQVATAGTITFDPWISLS